MKRIQIPLFAIAIASFINVAGAAPNDRPQPARAKSQWQEIILDSACRNPNVSVQPMTACVPLPQTPPQTPPKKIPKDAADAGQR